jgi:hypothetical protein
MDSRYVQDSSFPQEWTFEQVHDFQIHVLRCFVACSSVLSPWILGPIFISPRKIYKQMYTFLTFEKGKGAIFRILKVGVFF